MQLDYKNNDASSAKKPYFDKNFKKKSDHNKEQEQRSIVGIRFVTCLNEGGRQAQMSVCSVVGNREGKAGMGLGKAKDTSSALRKSVAKARKSMVSVNMCQKRTVHHVAYGKYCSTIVLVKKCKKGSGIKCSNAIRLLLNSFGFEDISVKCCAGSRNKINVLKAVFNAFQSILSPNQIAQKRGIQYNQVIGKIVPTPIAINGEKS